MPIVDAAVRLAARHGEDVAERILETIDDLLTTAGVAGWEQLASVMDVFGGQLLPNGVKSLFWFNLARRQAEPCQLIVQWAPAKVAREQLDWLTLIGGLVDLSSLRPGRVVRAA